MSKAKELEKQNEEMKEVADEKKWEEEKDREWMQKDREKKDE